LCGHATTGTKFSNGGQRRTIGERKKEQLIDDPTVVVDDLQPLTDKVKDVGDNGGMLLVRRHRITNTEVLRRRQCIRCVLVLVAIILAVMIAMTTALFIKKYINRPYMGMCDVTFYDEVASQSGNKAAQRSGKFQEEFEVDQVNNKYERLQVPPVLDFRQATVVHDFEKNLTAIVDRFRARCYILPLNRETVQPPKNFLDLLQKFQSGYYLPNAEIVRENYKVQTPAIDDLEPLGVYIESDCQYFETFHLVKDDQPIAMNKKKRFALSCTMAGNGFCLGASSDKMRCVTLVDCI